MNWAELVKDISIPLVGAFAGAYIAFYLESERRKRKKINEQYRAIMFAHFAVSRQRDIMNTLEKEHLGRYRDWSEAWSQLFTIPLGYSVPRLDVAELAFLLESSSPDLLNKLTDGQQRYEKMRSILTAFNETQEEVERCMPSSEDPNLDGLTVEEALKKIAGNRLVVRRKHFTRQLYEINERAISLSEKNLSDITKFVQERFPKRRLPKFKHPPEGKGQ